MNFPKTKMFFTKSFPYFTGIFIFLVIFGGVFGMTGTSLAADLYINRDCVNNGDGTNWSCASGPGASGAYNQFPDNTDHFSGYVWQRGVTYWIAGSDTQYVNPVVYYQTPGLTFRHATGTGRIVLKKATPDDHGTDEGWVAKYGEKQAVIVGNLNMWQSDTTIDGSYRSSPESGYGIKIQNDGSKGLIGTTNTFPVTGLVFKYIELTHVNYDSAANTAITLLGNGNNTIQYVYAHDLSGLCFKGNLNNQLDGGGEPWNTHGGFENIVIEESVCGRVGRTTSTDHTELLKDDGSASNVTIRNNFFYDWKSTGGLVLSGGQKNWYIYNNVFTQRTPELTCGNGAITALTAGTGWENIKVFNNTFANISSLRAYVFVDGFGDMSGTGNEVKNNLFFNVDISPATCTAGCLASHNWYSGVPFYTPNENEIMGSSNPFVEAESEDFRLEVDSEPIDVGANLSTYFTVDKDGTTRPQGAGWDIGAYEYIEYGDAIAPESPSGLSVW